MKLGMLFLSFVLLVLGCHPDPPNPPPQPDADAAPPPAGASCQTWCDHAAALGCDAAKPTPGGASCADVCTNMSNGPASFDVACRTVASSCAAADQCEASAQSKKPMLPDDGGLEATRATCAAWCRHADELKCPAAKPTPKGATCHQVCVNANSGTAKWNLKCKIAARTCAAADACP